MTTKVKKQPQVTLFFESKDDCVNACEKLGLSKRKCVDIDKSHNGNYSKLTGHYAIVYRDGVTLRVPLRAKMTLDQSMYLSLSAEEAAGLKACDWAGLGWIVS